MTVQTDRFLGDMRDEVYEVNFANGWFVDGRDFLDDVALLHSEVAEMFEAYRDHGFEDVTIPDALTLAKPLGFGSECADVLVRLLDTSHRQEIEFSWESLAAVPSVEPFPELTIGGHIAHLHWLIAQIVLPEPKVLDGTLQYLTTWCRSLGIDLLGEFERKLAFNRTRGYKHGNKLI